MSTKLLRGRKKPVRLKPPAQCLPEAGGANQPTATPALRVEHFGMDPVTDRSWVELSFAGFDGKRRRVLVPREQATRTSELRTQLARIGAILLPGTVPALCRQILEDKAAVVVPVTSQAGWVGPHFVLDGKIISGAKDLLVVPPEKRLPPSPPTAGTLVAWSRDVARLAGYSSRLTLVIALALSAPLILMAKGRNGIFNLCGRSTSGKSSALLVGNSVFRSGQRSRLLTWDVTETSVQQLASEHCDSLLCLDETQRKSLNQAKAAQAVLDAAFDMESGMGRVVDKNYRPHPLLWRIIVLSSSEDAMFADSADRMQGGRVRLFDIPAVAHAIHGIFETLPDGVGDSRTLMQAIEAASAANYGHAGRKFVAELARNRPVWRKKVAHWRDSFHKKIGVLKTSWDAKFTARFVDPFAFAYAAGRAAIEMNIVPWTPTQLRTAIVSCCRDAAIGTVAPVLNPAAGIGKLRRKLNNRSIVLDLRGAVERASSELSKACGFIVKREDLSMYAIKRPAFERWCGSTAMASAVLEQLRQAGRLIASGNSQTPYKQVQIPGITKRRRYVCLRYPFAVVLSTAA